MKRTDIGQLSDIFNSGVLRLKVNIIMVLILTAGNLVAQPADSCKVIKVISNSLSQPAELTEQYHPNGIYLLQNGIYQIKPSGGKVNYYRITKIWNDSLEIAWTVDSIAVRKLAIADIEKVVFPSLNDGIVGFPHPTMNRKKYSFTVDCQERFRLKKVKICLDSECSQSVFGFTYMTSGFGWKPVYRINDTVEMIDVNRIHRIKGNKLVAP